MGVASVYKTICRVIISQQNINTLCWPRSALYTLACRAGGITRVKDKVLAAERRDGEISRRRLRGFAAGIHGSDAKNFPRARIIPPATQAIRTGTKCAWDLEYGRLNTNRTVADCNA